MSDEYFALTIERMQKLEDAMAGLVKACGEIDAKSVGQDFHRAYSVAANALSGHDWKGGRFVPRFGSCPLPLNSENHTVTECISNGNCSCNEKERRQKQHERRHADTP